MNRTYLRGDMYYADLGRGVGSEQEGYRPVLIIQNNTGNKYSTTVIVAAISSKVDAKAKLPTHYLLKAENGLELPSLVLLEQHRTIGALHWQTGRVSHPTDQPSPCNQRGADRRSTQELNHVPLPGLCQQFLRHRLLLFAACQSEAGATGHLYLLRTEYWL